MHDWLLELRTSKDKCERRLATDKPRGKIALSCLLVFTLFFANATLMKTVHYSKDSLMSCKRIVGVIMQVRTSEQGCRGGWVRPIRAPGDRQASKPVRKFDRPAHNWLPGHRGVDLAAEHDALILAPETGTIVFAGTVAGKSVVSIRHGTAGNLVSTFEPARTSLHPGDQVERGRAWGTVQGHSDHCDGTCLHWGLRTSDRNYLNPMSKVDRHRILLKPG